LGWSALSGAAKTHFQARALSPIQTIAFDGAKLSVALEYDNGLGYEIMKRLLALVSERLDLYQDATHRRARKKGHRGTPMSRFDNW
jgi:hypothetical protein